MSQNISSGTAGRDSAKRIFDHRDALIRDRLWQMKKAATEILNLINKDLVSEDGEHYYDCDGTCDCCLIKDICMSVVDFSAVDIPGDAS